MNKALIVVDEQVDFCEGGRLAVPGGNAVCEATAEYIRTQGEQYKVIVFTKDWHYRWPDDNGGHFSATPDFVDSWPVHCEIGTDGADLHKALVEVPWQLDPLFGYNHLIFYKGTGQPDYSGFQGRNHLNHTLDSYLKEHQIDTVDVCGLAGDYCVKATAMDAKQLGYDTSILPMLVASVGGRQATMNAIVELLDVENVMEK